MFDKYRQEIQGELDAIREAGTFKEERVIQSPQSAAIQVPAGEVINFCANNYLGLADNEALIETAKRALDERGFGMASVRFICGTQDLHKQLEDTISRFYGHDDTILYSSCFDANAGLCETVLTKEDAIISDELNHASIIDGVRLCKAARFRYKNANMEELEGILKETQGHRRRMVCTDGVFSMDGYLAPLDQICDLADEYNAMVMVDDSHATGYIGATGRGTPEHFGVLGRVDVVTSTLGKALGGASGGFTSARGEIVDLLRQRSRPYLFSNSVPPPIVATALACIRMLSDTTELRDRLEANTVRFRKEMTAAGFDIRPGSHPIVPIMLGEARLAVQMADDLLGEGLYVIGFCYPVVPKGAARIRVQVSATHTDAHIDRAIAAFTAIGRKHGVIA